MADWSIDQGIGYEEQQIELLSKARNLSDVEIVNALIEYDDAEENLLGETKAAKIQSICQWYQEKGFLTKKQRACLNTAYAELDLVLP